ncbi:hypothetical protein PTKIN_Ptkin04bG0208300 [Pterospermum kingtungense]
MAQGQSRFLAQRRILTILFYVLKVNAPNYRRHRAKNRPPKHLMKLLELLRPSERFKRLMKFESFEVDGEEARNYWALPIVRFTGIAITLLNVDSSSIKYLMVGVNEGLIYVRHIEENLSLQGNQTSNKKTTKVVWLKIELCKRWLDMELFKLSLQ